MKMFLVFVMVTFFFLLFYWELISLEEYMHFHFYLKLHSGTYKHTG